MVTLYNMDVLKALKQMKSESVSCVMTSPPYWGLRSYNVDGQLGLEPTFEEHIKKMCDVFDEVKRVLRKDGTCFVNYGDTYVGSPPGNKFDGQKDKGDGLFSRLIQRNGIGEDNAKVVINKYSDPKNPASLRSREQVKRQSIPDKCLAMIPSRFAIEMINRGWILRNDIIWHKRNCMPSSVKDRFTVDFEHIFFFVKSKKYWFERQYDKIAESSVKDKRLDKGREEHIGKSATKQFGMNATVINSYGKNKRCVWDITTKPYREAHFATFPEELVKTPILSGCPENGIVLDPFAGSGTTLKVARDLHRDSIGIEINPKYCDLIFKRLYNGNVPLINEFELIK